MFACEQQVPCERLDLEEGNGWTNDIQIQAVRMPENEIVRMLRREASSVPNGSLMAGGLARVHDRQLSGPESAGRFVADVKSLMHLDHMSPQCGV